MAKGFEELKKELANSVLLKTAFDALLKKCSIEGKTPQEAAKEITAFLVKKGFELTEKEVFSFLENGTKKILSDEVLNGVTGGGRTEILDL